MISKERFNEIFESKLGFSAEGLCEIRHPYDNEFQATDGSEDAAAELLDKMSEDANLIDWWRFLVDRHAEMVAAEAADPASKYSKHHGFYDPKTDTVKYATRYWFKLKHSVYDCSPDKLIRIEDADGSAKNFRCEDMDTGHKFYCTARELTWKFQPISDREWYRRWGGEFPEGWGL